MPLRQVALRGSRTRSGDETPSRRCRRPTPGVAREPVRGGARAAADRNARGHPPSYLPLEKPFPVHAGILRGSRSGVRPLGRNAPADSNSRGPRGRLPQHAPFVVLLLSLGLGVGAGCGGCERGGPPAAARSVGIPIEQDGRVLRVIDGPLLDGTTPDFTDGDRHAWRLKTLLGVDAGTSGVEIEDGRGGPAFVPTRRRNGRAGAGAYDQPHGRGARRSRQAR